MNLLADGPQMCARYNLRSKMSVLASQFQLELALDFDDVEPRYNIAPTQEVLAIRHPRRLARVHWGLLPGWAEDPKLAHRTINARADSIATKPAFRSAFKKRRCLIVADGYYEWLTEGKLKQPFLFEVDGGQPFAFAGLWESCCLPGETSQRETCCLITTDANELAREVHDRMPVILPPEAYDAWLDPTTADVQALHALLLPFPADRMTARPVKTFVNNPRNEGPDCIADPGDR